jgi:hypothetical protein
MTVSELMAKLKDCAPNASVERRDPFWSTVPVDRVVSDGEKVILR